MSKIWLNNIMRYVLRKRMRRINYFSAHPHEVQSALLSQCIDTARTTEWGKMHDFSSIRTPQDFARQVPVQDYESLKPYINRMMLGERDVLWDGQVKWFSKSSGTTSDKSKFLPVTIGNLKKCHLKGAWDTTALIYQNRPQTTSFAGKMLVMGGSTTPFEPYPATQFGDVSAIMLQHMPAVGNYIYSPSLEIATMSNTEDKIDRMAHALIHEDMRSIGGVPTWTVVLLRRILELTKKDHILDVWPNLEVYVHGGVSFTPYRQTFSELIPKKDFNYWEIYNASEGFFSSQSANGADDMLLLLQNGIYYEFLPESEWMSDNPIAIPLSEVEVGRHYAPVITTNSGLWRYIVGDTVMFTSVLPYKIQVTGRTKQFVNAFGEEVMVANTDHALAETCQQFDAQVIDYTVAPIYFSGENGKGGHEWLIEFEREPPDMIAFNQSLDLNLQRINSDYEAKRFKSLAMEQLCLRPLPKGTFNNWLKMKGKYGGQHKVPRLANSRQYVDEILNFVGSRTV
jgi:GH3 auxin-responsive promoter